jgi:hypothetical protein
MPVGLFFVPYARSDFLGGGPRRVMTIQQYAQLIAADNPGRDDWFREGECLGNTAVVKVRASTTTLQTIAADPTITRLPLDRMSDPTSSLTAAQQTAVQNKLLSLGYSGAELNAAFPLGWNGPYVIRDVLRFALTRRLKPRYDAATDTIVLDGPVQPTATPEEIDAAVGNV